MTRPLFSTPAFGSILQRFDAWSRAHRDRGCGMDIDGNPLAYREHNGHVWLEGECACVCPDHQCIDAYLARRGQSDDALCLTCRDTGAIRNPRARRPDEPGFGRAIPCPDCNGPGSSRRVDYLWRQSNIPEALRHVCTLDAIPDDMHGRGLRARLTTWVESGYRDQPTLLLHGGVGRGKTFAALAVARAMLQRDASVYFTTSIDLLERLRATFRAASTAEGEPEATSDSVLHPARTARLLVLDDLGAERATDYAVEQLFSLVNYRHERRDERLTVVTTNVSREDAPDDRMWSRLFSVRTSCVIHVSGPDRRRG